MDRISGAGFILNAAGKRVFQDINQAAGISGTDVVALWLNGVQESIAAVVEAEGIVLSDADNTQLLTAIRDIANAAAAAVAYTLTAAKIASALGFTPVQQGTGARQLGDIVKIGWTGTNVAVTVDGSDQGDLLFQAAAASAYATKASLGGTNSQTGYQLFPNGTTLQRGRAVLPTSSTSVSSVFVSLPVSANSSILAVTAIPMVSNSAGGNTPVLRSPDSGWGTSGFTVYGDTDQGSTGYSTATFTQSVPFSWIAIVN